MRPVRISIKVTTHGCFPESGEVQGTAVLVWSVVKSSSQFIIILRAVWKWNHINYLHTVNQKNRTRHQGAFPGIPFDILLFLIGECPIIFGKPNGVMRLYYKH